MNLFQKMAAFAVINTVSYTALAADRDASVETPVGSTGGGVMDTRDLLQTAKESDTGDGVSQGPQWSQRLGRSGQRYTIATQRFNGKAIEPHNLSGHYTGVSATNPLGTVTFEVPSLEQSTSAHQPTPYSSGKGTI